MAVRAGQEGVPRVGRVAPVGHSTLLALIAYFSLFHMVFRLNSM